MKRPTLPAYLAAEPEPDRRLSLLVEGACMALAMSAATVLWVVLVLG